MCVCVCVFRGGGGDVHLVNTDVLGIHILNLILIQVMFTSCRTRTASKRNG